jgi:ATP-dependent DNA helicase RecQ
VRELLEDENGSEEQLAVLPVLEGLARISVQAERRHLRISRREIARWSGGDFGSARAALDALQQAGLLGWRDDGLRSGYVPSDLKLEPDALPVDWEQVAARRALELRKLKRMETYAYQGGCRRRYLLRYFGEEMPRRRCAACDRCTARA